MNNDKLIALRLDSALLKRIDRLVAVLGKIDDFRAHRLSRSSVIRLAVLRGLAELEKDYKG